MVVRRARPAEQGRDNVILESKYTIILNFLIDVSSIHEYLHIAKYFSNATARSVITTVNAQYAPQERALKEWPCAKFIWLVISPVKLFEKSLSNRTVTFEHRPEHADTILQTLPLLFSLLQVSCPA